MLKLTIAQSRNGSKSNQISLWKTGTSVIFIGNGLDTSSSIGNCYISDHWKLFLLSLLSILSWTLSFDRAHSQPLVQPSRNFLCSAMNCAQSCTSLPFFHQHEENLFCRVALVQLQGCKTCSAQCRRCLPSHSIYSNVCSSGQGFSGTENVLTWSRFACLLWNNLLSLKD